MIRAAEDAWVAIVVRISEVVRMGEPEEGEIRIIAEVGSRP